MDELGLINPIGERYGKQGATHVRGTECIDGVFVSNEIQVMKGGYIPFEWSPGDHKWPWIDIIMDEEVTNGNNKYRKMRRKATRKIPSVKKSIQ